ncbi:topoisomerase [Glycomyces sp. NPDC048151]|uniref:topoisomerase n=1 Tax=Glycomyces sp. NPDC048151 TaxID=3364002 RepID=UPI0037105165
MTLSTEQRLSLLESARSYAEQAEDSPVAAYLARKRGINDPALIKRLGLGYVAEPSAEHERFRGFMSIPYLRYGYGGPNVATIRFACITPGCSHEHHGKMNSLPGHASRLYNTRDLLAPVDEMCICEGEWDTMTALAYGLHAVGVPGVESWKPYMAAAFAGYKKVRIFAQSDDKGQSLKWANTLAAQIPAAVVEPCPHGLDLNDAHLHGKANALLKGPRAVPAGV